MRQVSLAKVIEALESGARPKGGASANTGEVPSLGAEHLTDDGGFVFRNPKRISQTFFDQLQAGRICQNDILIVKDGATTGRSSFVGEEFPFSQAAVNEHVFRISIDKRKAWPKFVYYYLMSAGGQRDIMRDFRGSTVGGIGRTFIDKVLLPFPRIDEQRRIAAILDKANALRRQRRRALELLKNLTQAVFLEMFGDPGTNPKRWPETTLGDVVHKVSDGPHVSPAYSAAGVPFLSTRHIRPGQILWNDLKYIDEEQAKEHWRKCRPEYGDILYTKGGSTGLAAAVNTERSFAIWVHVALLKTNHNVVEPAWLEAMLNSDFCFAQSQVFTHGIANRDLGLKRMIKIGFYLPPKAEQRRFCEIVDRLSKVEKLNVAADVDGSATFASLQHRAFTGQL